MTLQNIKDLLRNQIQVAVRGAELDEWCLETDPEDFDFFVLDFLAKCESKGLLLKHLTSTYLVFEDLYGGLDG